MRKCELFYIKMNLTGFQSAVDVNKLLGNLLLTGLGYLYYHHWVIKTWWVLQGSQVDMGFLHNGY